MDDKQRFNSEFKELIIRCAKVLEEAYKKKKFWYFYNCDEHNKENQDNIYISLETEKGKKIIGFYCWFWMDEHKDIEFQIKEQKTNPELKIEDAPPIKCILIREGDWHKPTYYGKELSDWRPSDFLSYEKDVLNKRYFLKEKNEAASYFLEHLKKIVNEDI